MFTESTKNKHMIEGAYKKLKSYYYYNKNFIMMREKIAELENDRDYMDKVFNLIAGYLSDPQSENHKEYFHGLISQIDYYSLPKKFEISQVPIKDKIISNATPKDKSLRTVNFFIDMPIELHIIDCLWTLFLGKLSYQHRLISDDSYGNMLADRVLFNQSREIFDSINFHNNRMFNIYFYKYSSWRNKAFTAMERNYGEKKHSILVSLDIKSYFYSIKIDFSKFDEVFVHDPVLKDIKVLTNTMIEVYKKYYEVISTYRKDFEQFSDKELPLPIGLFSSMLLGNLYLTDFDKSVKTINNISYYGRYVDDLLFVFSYDDVRQKGLSEIINNSLISNGLLCKNNNEYYIKGFENLVIQNDKIKAIHIDPNESRAMLDIYNKTIKIIPSQMNVLPNYELEITDFDESAYSIENFTQENKLRDIGKIGIDSYKVSRYFSTLIQKHKNINTLNSGFTISTESQIKKIKKFLTGSQSLEYYSNWMNYMYFLVLSRRDGELKKFYHYTKENITKINGTYIDKTIFKKSKSIAKKTRETLLNHLEICMCSALAIDLKIKHDIKFNSLATKLQKTNMFDHALISLPLINYMEYDEEISFTRMEVRNIGTFNGKIEDQFKIKWSPRFIRFEELLLLLFFNKHNKGAFMYEIRDLKDLDTWVEKFYIINHIKRDKFDIKINERDIEDYKLQEICVNSANIYWKDEIKIAIGNVKIRKEECTNVIENHWSGLDFKKKGILQNSLRECYDDGKSGVRLLVFPELYIPIQWLSEVIEFSRRSQIAVITGLQYMLDKNDQVHNYIATILPFKDGNYKNSFLFIREKNDYSPIEEEALAKMKKYCRNSKTPRYQIFKWNSLDIGTFVCYEFTDIFARALFKGKTDIIVAPVFNSDTTYFSNIIDSATRDLHTVIVQANTSIYGDSRITCPYDRDSKDVLKIKGGDIDHIMIGTINLGEIIRYQASYKSKMPPKVEQLSGEIAATLEITKDCTQCKNNCVICRKRPQPKKLSARYDTSRAKNKRI
jgi:predicted amidohydrolase